MTATVRDSWRILHKDQIPGDKGLTVLQQTCRKLLLLKKLDSNEIKWK